MTTQSWRLCDRILQFQTKWFTLIGEHLQPSNGTVLEYWRIEKADSVIIIPIQNQQLILPSLSYRPGLGKTTLVWTFQGDVALKASLLSRQRFQF